MSTSPPGPNQKSPPLKEVDKLESSTSPHPGDYLEARLAALEKGESSTNPHPTDYLEARLAALEKGQPPAKAQAPNGVEARAAAASRASGSNQAVRDLVASPGRLEPLGSPAAIQDLPLDALSLDVRAILSAPHVLIRPSQDDEAVVPFQLPNSPGQILCVTQSSKEAWFSLAWQVVHCDFYYDASSDCLVLKNLGAVLIHAVPILSDNKLDHGKRKVLGPRAACVISPGPWRISSPEEEAAEAWADILLFRRRFIAEKSKPPTGEAGLKRKNVTLLAGAPKRVRNDASEGDRSVVLFANPSESKMAVVTDGHPLVDFQPGETVTIRSLVEDSPKAETEDRSLDVVRHSSENYSLSHLRDIAATKDFSSVFRASHPVFGHTAVKIAQMWQSEERLMREVNHPSIIKIFGSDARLASIYMEYLPYPDLAASINRVPGHLFAGSTDDARRVLGDMASALAYLEGKGIIHNDIKPSNILYEQDRGAILIDFGLASTPTDTLCLGGTPWYIAPEFLDERKREPGSDVFALGVTLLYLLGKIPLPDATQRGWIIAKVFGYDSHRQLMKAWLEKVRRVGDQLSQVGIESVVEEMLHADPQQRIPAREIVQKLR
ncbi:kinase [Hirsutella rhossiliensis]|uniref:Kinase n=1 Tax=Hirsutella rhossiliensis TaxID=111463 RepID=A0A9P8N3P6_9HYPO|nr:kinase [Hirsutella rhossiliensis]KAH0966265.1 kinase [Hirsutella rhossiliensis]